ncbi:hypothetical protein ACNAW0_27425, partial [Micromonospora sp. SL1-18]|uniref:hypothetical protein n=1 Tax=Micromonospora sp. SL1-18 TaxID=3399128 RepID=UPI003A4E58ED
MTLPLDKKAAAAVSAASRLQRAEVFALHPMRYVLVAAAVISLVNAWAEWRISTLPALLAGGAIMVEGVMRLLERHFVLPQHPRRVGRHTLLIGNVPV